MALSIVIKPEGQYLGEFLKAQYDNAVAAEATTPWTPSLPSEDLIRAQSLSLLSPMFYLTMDDKTQIQSAGINQFMYDLITQVNAGKTYSGSLNDWVYLAPSLGVDAESGNIFVEVGTV